MAEAVRFELTVGLTPSLVFKTSSINHSDKPPYFGQFSIFLEKSLELPRIRKRYNSKSVEPQGLFGLEVPISSQDFKTDSLNRSDNSPCGVNDTTSARKSQVAIGILTLEKI